MTETPILDITALENWIRSDALWLEDSVDIINGLAERIVDAGIPIFRMTTGIPVLHPNVRSVSILWEAGKETSVRLYTGQVGSQPIFQNSPLFVVYNTGETVHVPITPEPTDNEYGIVPDMRTVGATDYVAVAMRFSDRSNKALTFATRAPGGFRRDDIAGLESITAQVAPILEIHTQRRKAMTLLETYVGATAGQRVLDGEIMRGHGETIRAIVWFSDLRGFTNLGNSLAGAELIALLNRYFGAVAQAVEDAGGEVLKFIGDAVLAIIPYDNETQAKEMAVKALFAAKTALDNLAADGADTTDGIRLRCGIALHAGDVFYGNVGGEKRLDFTVIGPAVNLTSRIEGMTKELDRSLLVSKAFAELLPERPPSQGHHILKGIDGPVEIFAPNLPG